MAEFETIVVTVSYTFCNKKNLQAKILSDGGQFKSPWCEKLCEPLAYSTHENIARPTIQ